MTDSPKFNRNFYSNSDDRVAGFADIEPIKDDQGRVIRYKTTIENPTWADGSDAYANNFDAFISIASAVTNSGVLFKAFITTFNETYTPNFNPTEVFGRTDPIYQYKNTSRSITLAWKIPAASEGEAYENLGKVQKLISFLYPSYTDADNALTISQSPLIRMKVMNLVSNNKDNSIATQGDFNALSLGLADSTSGLLGAITNVSVNHNLDNPDYGVFHIASGTVIPKAIEISLDFKALTMLSINS